VLSKPPFLAVEYHRVALPDGRVIDDWPWVITPGYINVVALTVNGEFVLFRQTKYAVEGTSLAPVGGYLEPGEEPLAAAQRELREEAGYEAADWEPLGSFAVDGNRGAGRAYLFLARNCTPVGRSPSDDLETQELLLLSQAEVEQALVAGEFKVLAWAAMPWPCCDYEKALLLTISASCVTGGSPLRAEHLKQGTHLEVVATVAGAGNRFRGDCVEAAVLEEGCVDVHPDHLAQRQVGLQGSAMQVVKLHNLQQPALEGGGRLGDT
jgi:ADP-ribose pyrophosphatase